MISSSIEVSKSRPLLTVPGAGRELVVALEARLQILLEEVRAMEAFKAIESPMAPATVAFAIMREIFAEVYSYQKRIDEAVFAAVGRFGLHISEQELVRSMIAVQIEEVGHGEIALNDFAALGGSVDDLRKRQTSPESFALIAVTDRLARVEHPLAHLGFMFFFERFTTLITGVVAPLLSRKGYPDAHLEFMRLHATEDIRHANMLANVIVECANKYDGAEQAIRYGFECFGAVYPVPIWTAAYKRVMKSLGEAPTAGEAGND